MKEYILCAAIWYKDLSLIKNFDANMRPINCDKGIVFCGYRHPHCMYSMIAITGKRSVTVEVGQYVQGFLTSKNRFVSREEAASIASAASQCDSSISRLHSEDLY